MAWYTVMNVLEDYSVSVFTGHWKIQAVFPHQNLSTHKSHYTVLYLEERLNI
jgi:hypothetical protein